MHPHSASSGHQIAIYASQHRSQLLTSYLIIALGLAVLLVFAAGLYRIIRRAEPADGWLAVASVTSAVGGAAIFGVGTALFMVVAYRPTTTPAVVRAFWDAGWLAYNIAGFGFVAWMAVIIVATLRYDALPRWSAWVAIPVAAINFVGPFAVQQGSGAFSPQGWFAMVVALTFAVWLLVVALAAGRPSRVALHAFQRRNMKQLDSTEFDMSRLDITTLNVAVERVLEHTSNPRHRYLLQSYIRHRYLETAGRWEEILDPALTTEHPFYRFSLLGQPPFSLDGRDQVAALYRHWAETDQCIFYVENEQVAVGDHMVVARATAYQQTLGVGAGQRRSGHRRQRHVPHQVPDHDAVAL